MQSTEAQEARAKTSTSRTSSTRSKEDRPQHITITIDGMDCNIVEATQPMDSAPTQTWTSEPNTNQKSPIASQTIGAKKRRYYAGHITEIRIFPDHQACPSNPQQSESKSTTYLKRQKRHHGPHNNHMMAKAAQISTKIQKGWSSRHRQATPIARIAASHLI